MEIPSKGDAAYSYDHVCDAHETQEDIFASAGVPVVDAFLEGYNGCLIAYGQTGAGKTFTMQGPGDPEAGEGDPDGASERELGLIPRVLRRVFQRVEDDRSDAREETTRAVKCSYLEIYNEQVTDLLVDPAELQADGQPGQSGRAAPTIREHERRGAFVEGLLEAAVRSAEETYDVFTRGSHNRRVGATAMNRESSRSHAVFTVSLESSRRAHPGAAWRRRFSTLHLVDLAGSERQKATEAGGARLKEASAINKSLSALGNVIKALADVADGKDRHVPYRDSKLTFLLKDALGGNARCTLLACVSPAAGQLEETLSTLKFAQRAKQVKTRAVANEEAVGSAAELAAEIVRLRALLRERDEAGDDRSAREYRDEALDAARLEEPDGANRDDPAGFVRRLESLLAKSNRVAAASARDAASSVAALEKRLEEVEELSRRLEKNLQSTKMVLRLRDEALKKSKASGGGGASSGASADVSSAEVEQLRKMAECPPEVVRARLEMQQMRLRVEHLEEENGAREDAGKMRRLEGEIAELRAVRTEESEVTARAIEERDETEARNAELAAERDASERLAAESAEEAAKAEAARASAEEARAAAEAGRIAAEEDAARARSTFEEQKAVMEEMFGQIETLDALRAKLEGELESAGAAQEAARVRLAETEAALREAAEGKVAAEEAAAAAAAERDRTAEAKAEAAMEAAKELDALRAKLEGELESAGAAQEAARVRLAETEAALREAAEGKVAAEEAAAAAAAERDRTAEAKAEAAMEAAKELDALRAKLEGELESAGAAQEAARVRLAETEAALREAAEGKVAAEAAAAAAAAERDRTAEAKAEAAMEAAKELDALRAKLEGERADAETRVAAVVEETTRARETALAAAEAKARAEVEAAEAKARAEIEAAEAKARAEIEDATRARDSLRANLDAARVDALEGTHTMKEAHEAKLAETRARLEEAHEATLAETRARLEEARLEAVASERAALETAFASEKRAAVAEAEERASKAAEAASAAALAEALAESDAAARAAADAAETAHANALSAAVDAEAASRVAEMRALETSHLEATDALETKLEATRAELRAAEEAAASALDAAAASSEATTREAVEAAVAIARAEAAEAAEAARGARRRARRARRRAARRRR